MFNFKWTLVKYFSNFATASAAPRGFRLDNFTIAGESNIDDYVCLKSIPYDMYFNNYEAQCWNIEGAPDANDNVTIQWEFVDNFAASTEDFSAKINPPYTAPAL